MSRLSAKLVTLYGLLFVGFGLLLGCAIHAPESSAPEVALGERILFAKSATGTNARVSASLVCETDGRLRIDVLVKNVSGERFLIPALRSPERVNRGGLQVHLTVLGTEVKSVPQMDSVWIDEWLDPGQERRASRYLSALFSREDFSLSRDDIKIALSYQSPIEHLPSFNWDAGSADCDNQ